MTRPVRVVMRASKNASGDRVHGRPSAVVSGDGGEGREHAGDGAEEAEERRGPDHDKGEGKAPAHPREEMRSDFPQLTAGIG